MIDWLFRRVQAVSASFSKEVGCVKPTRICSPRCVGMSNGESNVHRPLRALVYAGRGAGTRSVLSAVETLQSSLRESILVCSNAVVGKIDAYTECSSCLVLNNFSSSGRPDHSRRDTRGQVAAGMFGACDAGRCRSALLSGTQWKGQSAYSRYEQQLPATLQALAF